jgi:hypothetical protein
LGKKTFPKNVLQLATDVLAGWNQISTTLAFGTLNAAALSADITAANTVEADIAKLESQLNDKRNQREIIYLGMWDKASGPRRASRPTSATTYPSST